MKDLRMDLDQLRGSLQIDTGRLDEAMLTHSDLFYRVARLYARAQSRSDGALDSLKATESELLNQLRRERMRKGKRVTESQLKSELASLPRFREAQNALLVAQRAARDCLALKEAYQHRQYMLRSLVQLYVSEYFSVAQGDAGASRVRRRKAETVKAKVAKGYTGLARRYSSSES
jgi:hypothetical protein